MTLSSDDLAMVEDLVRRRIAEHDRDVRREMLTEAIRHAAASTPVPSAMPCIVQSVGLVVDGVLKDRYAICIPDDANSPETGTFPATIVGPALVAGNRALLLFFPGGAIYVLGPIAL